MDEQKDSIPGFYRDRDVFITGATGFVGKGLVEKLLRSCSEIKTIYLLLRPKKKQIAGERLNDLLKDELFERIKSENPDVLTKLVLIQGDLSRAGLGISTYDLNLLLDNVSVVFHLAATVKFNAPLKESLTMNALGTRQIIELCHKMKKLEALIHVSTTYCNCNRAIVEEVIYDFPAPAPKLIDMAEWMDEDLMNTLTPHLIRGRPNTYTYTKALAESLFTEERGTLPVAIVRPSVVTAAWKEPFPGWISDCNGLTGIFVPYGKGYLRSMQMKASCIADLIPVDIVINIIIAVAWYTATSRSQDIKVYNCTSGSINNITWGSVIREMAVSTLRYPSCKIFRHPNCCFTDRKVKKYLSVMLYHHIPAYFLDLVSVIIGRKPKFVRLYKKLERFIELAEYFTTREWTLTCDNVLMLQGRMPIHDAKEFNFNIKSLHWPTYIENYVLGIRRFLYKEEESSLPIARKKLKRIFFYTKLSHFSILIMLLLLILIVYSGIVMIISTFL